MTLTIQDLQHFQTQHPDHRLELVNGAIIVMSPCGFESDEIAAEIIAQLRNWVRPRRLGRVTGSSAGFILPNATSDTRAPDASFVKADRMRRTTEDFANLVPDLMFEVRSKTDSLAAAIASSDGKKRGLTRLGEYDPIRVEKSACSPANLASAANVCTARLR